MKKLLRRVVPGAALACIGVGGFDSAGESKRRCQWGAGTCEGLHAHGLLERVRPGDGLEHVPLRARGPGEARGTVN